MGMADAVTFNPVHTAGTDIEQQVDEVIGQQVDFIDVENALICFGEQSRVELDLLAIEDFLQIQRTQQHFFRGTERQGHKIAMFRGDLRQAPGQGGFRGTARATDQHTADRRVDRGEHQSQFILCLAGDRREREFRRVHNHRAARHS